MRTHRPDELARQASAPRCTRVRYVAVLSADSMRRACVLVLLVALTVIALAGAASAEAICRDGWHSQSSGPGTCSHHGGVDHYVDAVATENRAGWGGWLVVLAIGSAPFLAVLAFTGSWPDFMRRRKKEP